MSADPRHRRLKERLMDCTFPAFYTHACEHFSKGTASLTILFTHQAPRILLARTLENTYQNSETYRVCKRAGGVCGRRPRRYAFDI